MGYRSDVTISCGEKAYGLFTTACKKYYFKPSGVYKTQNGLHILQWEWCKWYEDFESVRAIGKIMNFLDNHFQDRNEYSYHYIRIGEDCDDIEERWNGDYLDDGVSIVRTVDLPNEKILEEIFI